MTGTVVRYHRAAQRTVAAVAACAAVLLTAVPSAQAGPIYTIKTAPSPSSPGGPIQGGGSWITNKPRGYYLGRATTGSRFNLVPGHGGTWHYGRAADTVDTCGWVRPGAPGTYFNAKKHALKTGTRVAATNSPSCIFSYNYFHGTNFAHGANAGHWANPAGQMTAGFVLY